MLNRCHYASKYTMEVSFMANFEDYLNDFDLDEKKDNEPLDPVEFSETYGDNSDTGYEDAFSTDFNSDDYAAYSSDEPADTQDVYANVDDGFSSDDYEDYEEPQPKKKTAAKAPISLGSLSGLGKSRLASNGVLYLVVAVSIVLSLIAIISSAGVKKSVNDDIQTLYSQMSSVISTNSQVLDKLAVIEDTLNLSAKVSAETNSRYISITKQPTSVDTTLGRGSDGIVPVFTIIASGNGISASSFNWQKKTASGEWVNIDFAVDNNSRNDTLGLQLENNKDQDSGGYYSKIWATGLTAEAFGSYRCVITDSAGERAWSDVVEINRK